MRAEDLAAELEKLKSRLDGLSTRMKITRDHAEKEDLRQEMEKLQAQIEILQRYYGSKK